MDSHTKQPTTIRLQCPDCGKRLRGTPFYEFATIVARRQCRCGQFWSVRVTPLTKSPGMWTHELVWHRRDSIAKIEKAEVSQ